MYQTKSIALPAFDNGVLPYVRLEMLGTDIPMFRDPDEVPAR